MILRIFIFSLFLFNSMNANGQDPTQFLIAAYNFNGNTKDESRYGNHGYSRGNVIFGNDRFGSPCGAIEFNGKDAFVEVPNSASLQSPAMELSVTVWFKLNQNAEDLGWHTILCKGDRNWESHDSPQYRIQGTTKTLSISTSFTENLNLKLQKDTWYHYAVTWDGRMVRAYLNGSQFFKWPYRDRLSPNNRPLHIGRDNPGKEELFSGSMDELRIYRKCLSSLDVQQIYQGKSEQYSSKPCDSQSRNNYDRNRYNDVKVLPPQVTILEPKKTVVSSNNSSFLLSAKTKNINDKSQITAVLNEVPVNRFRFDPGSNSFSTAIQLKEGHNIFEILVENQYGQDKDYRFITYEKQEIKPIRPPKVRIITPLDKSTYKTQECQVKARVYNVNRKAEIEIYVNGRSIKQFNYNTAAQIIDFSFTSSKVNNQVVVLVNNDQGMHSDEVLIIQEKNDKKPAHELLKQSEIQVKNSIVLPPNDVIIECFDHNKIDNDTVSVILNDEIIFDRIGLRAKHEKKAVFRLKYQKGQSFKIISKAWNEGEIPTNTLCIEVYDQKGYHKIVKLNSRANVSEALKLTFP